MKKIIIFIISILSFVAFTSYVKAETFYEGEFLTGQYIKKKKDDVTYYMTIQYIRDSNGNIVYCLEPFTKFVEGKPYTEFIGNLTNYNSLTEEQKRRISLIIYYGYGYNGRLEEKWYAITQFMIWKELVPEGDVYFTGSLNGRKVTRYVEEMNAVYDDINSHETYPFYAHEYEIDFGSDLLISEFAMDNKIVYSDYVNELNNGLLIKKIEKDGKVSFSKNSNYYAGKVAIFDSTDSQDLIKPGNVENPVYDIFIKVRKGNIKLDIKKDSSVYTVESDFNNTCYEILNSLNERVDYVCTGPDELVYNSIDLVYGEYIIRQVSHGIGYLNDDKTYQVTINNDNTNPNVTLYNYLLKNKIEITKYACKEDRCAFEENAEFQIIDKNNKNVDLLITDKLGSASITLGYGKYIIKQIKGIDDYSLVEEYSEKIVDEETKHKKSLFNNYIKKEEIVEKEGPVIETKMEYMEPNIEVPKTKTDFPILWYFSFVIWLIKRIILS